MATDSIRVNLAWVRCGIGYQVPSYLLFKIFLVDTSWIDKFDPIAVKYLCL